jgi:hypothetical protein
MCLSGNMHSTNQLERFNLHILRNDTVLFRVSHEGISFIPRIQRWLKRPETIFSSICCYCVQKIWVLDPRPTWNKYWIFSSFTKNSMCSENPQNELRIIKIIDENRSHIKIQRIRWDPLMNKTEVKNLLLVDL